MSSITSERNNFFKRWYAKQNTTPSFKVALIGDYGVGKTSYLHRLADGSFSDRALPSRGVETRDVAIHTQYGPINLQISDVPGQLRLNSSSRDCQYQDSQAVIVMFDITANTTYANVPSFYADLIRSTGLIPTVVCGNKQDLAPNAVLSEKNNFATKLGLPYFSLSARSSLHCERPLLWLARALTGEADIELRSLPWPSISIMPTPDLRHSTFTSDAPKTTITSSAERPTLSLVTSNATQIILEPESAASNTAQAGSAGPHQLENETPLRFVPALSSSIFPKPSPLSLMTSSAVAPRAPLELASVKSINESKATVAPTQKTRRYSRPRSSPRLGLHTTLPSFVFATTPGVTGLGIDFPQETQSAIEGAFSWGMAPPTPVEETYPQSAIETMDPMKGMITIGKWMTPEKGEWKEPASIPKVEVNVAHLPTPDQSQQDTFYPQVVAQSEPSVSFDSLSDAVSATRKRSRATSSTSPQVEDQSIARRARSMIRQDPQPVRQPRRRSPSISEPSRGRRRRRDGSVATETIADAAKRMQRRASSAAVPIASLSAKRVEFCEVRSLREDDGLTTPGSLGVVTPLIRQRAVSVSITPHQASRDSPQVSSLTARPSERMHSPEQRRSRQRAAREATPFGGRQLSPAKYKRRVFALCCHCARMVLFVCSTLKNAPEQDSCPLLKICPGGKRAVMVGTTCRGCRKRLSATKPGYVPRPGDEEKVEEHIRMSPMLGGRVRGSSDPVKQAHGIITRARSSSRTARGTSPITPAPWQSPYMLSKGPAPSPFSGVASTASTATPSPARHQRNFSMPSINRSANTTPAMSTDPSTPVDAPSRNATPLNQQHSFNTSVAAALIRHSALYGVACRVAGCLVEVLTGKDGIAMAYLHVERVVDELRKHCGATWRLQAVRSDASESILTNKDCKRIDLVTEVLPERFF